MEDVRLIFGDALEVLRTLDSNSVDAVVTDPPYFLPAAHYNTRTGTARSLADLCILEHFFRDVFTAIRRVLKADGFAYIFCDGQSYPAFYVTAYAHFRSLRPLVWDKQTSINGYSWRHQHELILFCASAESPNVKTGDGDVLRCRAVPVDDREHLAQKPVELLARLIDKTTPAGGVVLDPFMGSGATGIAAMQTGRQFVGIDVDPNYFAIAEKSIAYARTGGPLFAQPAPEADLFSAIAPENQPCV